MSDTSRDSDVSTVVTGVTSGSGVTFPDFGTVSIENEAMAHGWTPITAPAGGTPAPAIVGGMRGDPDLDDDDFGKSISDPH